MRGKEIFRHGHSFSLAELNQFQPLQLYTLAVGLGEVVLGLSHQPALLGAAENPGQPHGHFGRDAALPVYKFRKRVASHPEGGGGGRDGQT